MGSFPNDGCLSDVPQIVNAPQRKEVWMNGEQTQADSFNNFWIATWSAWRTGQLDFLLPSLSRCAEGPFETFGRLGDVYPGKAYPMIQTCFASFPPLDGEYLVYTISVRKDELSMLITNMRVWVFLRSRPKPTLYQHKRHCGL